jgi:hypothetical protein
MTREQLRQPADVTSPAEPRGFLQHMADYFRLQNEHSGNPAMALHYHNVQAPAPFAYNLPGSWRTVTLGMPVLHVSIGLGTKLLKLVGALAANAEAFTRLLTEHKLNFHEYHGGTLAGPQVHDLLAGPAPKYEWILEAIRYNSSTIHISSSGAAPSQQRRLSVHFVKVHELFRHFSAAYGLYTQERFLTPEEIDQLEDACHTFTRLFREWFPGESITPKLQHPCGGNSSICSFQSHGRSLQRTTHRKFPRRGQQITHTTQPHGRHNRQIHTIIP